MHYLGHTRPQRVLSAHGPEHILYHAEHDKPEEYADQAIADIHARGKLPINYPRYTDERGEKIIIDRVLRYENLDTELTEIFAQLNVPYSGSLGVRAKSGYRGDRRSYQEVFNERQRQLVEKAFAREIELHGYHF